jgi:hypothetical protein
MSARRSSGFITLCQPSKVKQPPTGALWVYEIKHDGPRFRLAIIIPANRCVPGAFSPLSLAACRYRAARRSSRGMSSKSRETLYGGSIRASAERAKKARKTADQCACIAWNQRMLGYQGPAQPSPTLGDALNAGFGYLEVRCLGCDTHQTVALDIVRRPKHTPVHELERYLRCKDCSQVRRYPYKRSHLVALRQTKISASDPPSTWWPGER